MQKQACSIYPYSPLNSFGDFCLGRCRCFWIVLDFSFNYRFAVEQLYFILSYIFGVLVCPKPGRNNLLVQPAVCTKSIYVERTKKFETPLAVPRRLCLVCLPDFLAVRKYYLNYRKHLFRKSLDPEVFNLVVASHQSTCNLSSLAAAAGIAAVR